MIGVSLYFLLIIGFIFAGIIGLVILLSQRK